MTKPADAPASYRSIASRRMARRLLSGAGTAAICAYRLAPDTPPQMVLHAFDDHGHILVAAVPTTGHPLASVASGEPVEVRLDVELEAADAGVRVTTASCHLLGSLVWLDPATTEGLLAGASAACHCSLTGGSPMSALTGLAQAEGGRLGVIHADRVTVHDAMGVGGHSITEVLGEGAKDQEAPLWSTSAVVSAQEAVCALGEITLDMLVSGVLDASVPGVVCSVRPSQGLCARLRGRVLCVDVSPYGVTLMRLGKEETVTVQLLLPEGTTRPSRVGEILSGLAGEAVAAELLRG